MPVLDRRTGDVADAIQSLTDDGRITDMRRLARSKVPNERIPLASLPMMAQEAACPPPPSGDSLPLDSPPPVPCDRLPPRERRRRRLRPVPPSAE